MILISTTITTIITLLTPKEDQREKDMPSLHPEMAEGRDLTSFAPLTFYSYRHRYARPDPHGSLEGMATDAKEEKSVGFAWVGACVFRTVSFANKHPRRYTRKCRHGYIEVNEIKLRIV